MKNFSKTAVLILGMHRSGTSALSGVLNILGLDFGANLMPPTQDNPKGYFENQNFYKINEEILKILNTSWDDLGEFPTDFSKDARLETIKKELKEKLNGEFPDKNIFGIKDPRLCLLFPLYQEILTELGFDIKSIVVWRNEAEIADSLQKRDGMDFEKAIKLCRKYWNTLEKNTPNTMKITVNFEDLLEDPETIIFKIKKKIPEIPGSYEETKNQIAEFLEKELKHHKIRTVDRLVLFTEKITEKEQETLKLNSLIAEQEKNIAEKEKAIVEKENILKEKDAFIAQKDEEITEKNEVISKKDEEINVGKKMLARLKKEAEHKDQIIFEKEKQIAEIKNGLIFKMLEKWDFFVKRIFKKYPKILEGYRNMILKLRKFFRK